jgi:hypothetical protein
VTGLVRLHLLLGLEEAQVAFAAAFSDLNIETIR